MSEDTKKCGCTRKLWLGEEYCSSCVRANYHAKISEALEVTFMLVGPIALSILTELLTGGKGKPKT